MTGVNQSYKNKINILLPQPRICGNGNCQTCNPDVWNTWQSVNWVSWLYILGIVWVLLPLDTWWILGSLIKYNRGFKKINWVVLVLLIQIAGGIHPVILTDTCIRIINIASIHCFAGLFSSGANHCRRHYLRLWYSADSQDFRLHLFNLIIS